MLGGNLDGLSAFKKHMDQSKSAADDTTIPKEAVDLMGVGIGGNIKVFWNLSQKKIPNASANEISYKPMSMEAVKDFESLFLHHFPRNRMFGSWNDDRSHHLTFKWSVERDDYNRIGLKRRKSTSKNFTACWQEGVSDKVQKSKKR